MKKIVCEVCSGTDFLKENGVFMCQSCGCRYALEEVRNMLKDVDDNDEPITQTAAASAQTEENVVNNNQNKNDRFSHIPRHTPASVNRLSVDVIKVGHETYTASSVLSISALFGEPKPVFVDGPDEVGNIGAEIRVENLAGKTIKYVTVYLVPYNSV